MLLELINDPNMCLEPINDLNTHFWSPGAGLQMGTKSSILGKGRFIPCEPRVDQGASLGGGWSKKRAGLLMKEAGLGPVYT